MKKLKIADGIHMLTMNVEDILFEGIWEIANGVTLNSYIIQGEKTAIIDGVIGWDGVPDTFYRSMEEIGVEPKKIDWSTYKCQAQRLLGYSNQQSKKPNNLGTWH